MIGRGFQLSVMVALGSEAASGSLRPPRLVTGTESALPITHGSGSSVWLVLAAALAGCLTILWWVWWGVRVYRSRVDAEERAFRRLSRAMRLRVFEREVLRRACAARGVHPIAAIGSPEVARSVLVESGAPARRVRRLRRILCDTSAEDAGTSEVSFSGEDP
jgi:hypothetical protein